MVYEYGTYGEKGKCIQGFEGVKAGKIALGRPKFCCVDTMEIDIKIRVERAKCLYLAQNRAAVDTVTMCRVTKNVGNFLG
jgi:hypothetical protein